MPARACQPLKQLSQCRPLARHKRDDGNGTALGRLNGAWIREIIDRKNGVEIEKDLRRDQGRSLYFRDPAGNSVELVDGDIWPSP